MFVNVSLAESSQILYNKKELYKSSFKCKTRLKGAIVEGKVVGVDTIKELSSLPNRDGMLSMLLSCLQAPVRSFACAVKAVADKDGEAAPAEEAAAE